jgi:hypothetical protein
MTRPLKLDQIALLRLKLFSERDILQSLAKTVSGFLAQVRNIEMLDNVTNENAQFKRSKYSRTTTSYSTILASSRYAEAKKYDGYGVLPN